MLTRDAEAVVADPDIDVVVEVIGGIEPARQLILDALEHGKPVVTANKELLANVGAELFAAADAGRASTCSSRRPWPAASRSSGALRESLRGEPIDRVHGDRQRHDQLHPHEDDRGGRRLRRRARPRRSASGYAERDPTADVEGFDAGAKAAIMAVDRVRRPGRRRRRVPRGHQPHHARRHRRGHAASATSSSCSAIAERRRRATSPCASTRRWCPIDHPLASVRDSYNAVFVEGDAVGKLMFYGRGAGGRPTASAVLGDLIDAAVNLRQGHARSDRARSADARIRPIDETTAEYYLPLEVVDRPGVLHAVTGVFAKHDVSIRTAEQEGHGDEARLVFITHDAREADVQATLRDLRDLEVVRAGRRPAAGRRLT